MSFHKFLPLFLCLFVLSTVTPSVLGTELSIVATADSYTDNSDPDVNYGGSDYLHCYNYESEYTDEKQYVWLKFDLSEIPSEATVDSIILRMHTSLIGTFATNKVGVFLCSNTDWQEMTITWNNCPEVAWQPIDTVYVGSEDKYYDFNVTSGVKGKSVVTLVLKTLEPTSLLGWTTFDSKERDSVEDRPRLIVGYTSPSQPLTVDPFFGLLIASLVVIIVVVALVVYAVARKKKQPPSPSTPQIPSSKPS